MLRILVLKRYFHTFMFSIKSKKKKKHIALVSGPALECVLKLQEAHKNLCLKYAHKSLFIIVLS